MIQRYEIRTFNGTNEESKYGTKAETRAAEWMEQMDQDFWILHSFSTSHFGDGWKFISITVIMTKDH